MDALTDILNTLKLRSSLYFRTELTAPWGIELPSEDRVARFHIVTRGQCWLKIEGQEEPLFMSNGDLVIIPYGASHSLTDAVDEEAQPLNKVLEDANYDGKGVLVYGGGGSECCLVCGEFAFGDMNNHPLLDNLPVKLFVKANKGYSTKWLDSAIGFIAHEANSMEAGANAIIDRLSEIILIQVIRVTLAVSKERIPFLSAFNDERINKVLSHIHNDPGADWNVERLGQLVNMSRTSFSTHFSTLIRMTPLQYVLFVRLQKASQLLLETKDSIFSIANTIGYRSEASFSLAFKKQFNIRPGEYRKHYLKEIET